MSTKGAHFGILPNGQIADSKRLTVAKSNSPHDLPQVNVDPGQQNYHKEEAPMNPSREPRKECKRRFD